MNHNQTNHEAGADVLASRISGGNVTATYSPKNPDPLRCVCRFDTNGTTVCGLHGNYAITYYDDRDDR